MGLFKAIRRRGVVCEVSEDGDTVEIRFKRKSYTISLSEHMLRLEEGAEVHDIDLRKEAQRLFDSR